MHASLFSPVLIGFLFIDSGTWNSQNQSASQIAYNKAMHSASYEFWETIACLHLFHEIARHAFRKMKPVIDLESEWSCAQSEMQ